MNVTLNTCWFEFHFTWNSTLLSHFFVNVFVCWMRKANEKEWSLTKSNLSRSNIYSICLHFKWMWTHHKNVKRFFFSFSLVFFILYIYLTWNKEKWFGVSGVSWRKALVDEWHKIQSNFSSFSCWCRWFILHEKIFFFKSSCFFCLYNSVNNTIKKRRQWQWT